MSNKPTLNKLTQISNKEESAVALLNENFEKIEKAIEDSVSRSGVVPTAMLTDLDMGSKSLINLGAPKGDNDAVRYVDVRNALGNTKEYSEKASAAASRAEDSAASANTSAVAARFSSESASASAEDCNEAVEVVAALKEELITNPSVKTVADNIADVNTVAGRIDDVTSVAENINTVVDAKDKVIDLSTRILFGNLGDVQATASLVAPRGCEFLDGHVITKETYPQAFIALEEGRLPSRSTAEYKAAAGSVSDGIFVPENSYPFFGYDSGSSTAYLPIAWDIFIEASNTHADIVEAGLPNITGEAGNYGNGNGSHKLSSGAMYVRDYTDVTGESEDTQGNSLIYGIDASRSSAIYGKSDTVQPNALRYRYYIVLAEGATMVYTNRPSVATYKDLPRTGNTMGDVRGARDTNISYVWAKQADGSFAWSSLGMSIGITEQRLQEVVGDVSDILAEV